MFFESFVISREPLSASFSSSLSLSCLQTSPNSVEILSLSDPSSLGAIGFDSMVTCFCWCDSSRVLVVGDSNGSIHFIDPNRLSIAVSKQVASAPIHPVSIGSSSSSSSVDSVFVLLSNGDLFCATGISNPTKPSWLKAVIFSLCKTPMRTAALLPWSVGVGVVDDGQATLYHINQRSRIEPGPTVTAAAIWLGVNSKQELLVIEDCSLVFYDSVSGDESWRFPIPHKLEAAIFREINSQIFMLVGLSGNFLNFYTVRDCCMHSGSFELPGAGGEFSENFFVQKNQGLFVVKLIFPEFHESPVPVAVSESVSLIWQTPRQIARRDWREAEFRGIEKAHDAVEAEIHQVPNFSEFLDQLAASPNSAIFCEILKKSQMPANLSATAVAAAFKKFGAPRDLIFVASEIIKSAELPREAKTEIQTAAIFELKKKIVEKSDIFKFLDFSIENFHRAIPVLLKDGAASEAIDIAIFSEFSDPADIATRMLVDLAASDNICGFQKMVEFLDERNLFVCCSGSFLACGFDSKFSEFFPGFSIFSESIDDNPEKNKSGILDCPEEDLLDYLATMEKVSLARKFASLTDPPVVGGFSEAWGFHSETGTAVLSPSTAQGASAAAISGEEKFLAFLPSFESSGFHLLAAAFGGDVLKIFGKYFRQISEEKKIPDFPIILACLRILQKSGDLQDFIFRSSKNSTLTNAGNFSLISKLSAMASRLDLAPAPPTKRLRTCLGADSPTAAGGCLERVARCADILSEFSVIFNWTDFSENSGTIGRQLLPDLAKNCLHDFSVVQKFAKNLEISKVEAMMIWLEAALQQAPLPFLGAEKIFQEFSKLSPELASQFIQNSVLPSITDLSRLRRCLCLVPDQAQISRFTCLVIALQEFSDSTGRQFSNFHFLKNASPEEIENALIADLRPTLEDFWASEKLMSRLGYGGDSLKLKAIESGKFLVSHLEEISRSIEDQVKLKDAAEKIFRATTDENLKIETGAWLRRIGVSLSLRKEIDVWEFSRLWVASGYPQSADPGESVVSLFWNSGPFPTSSLFWKFLRLAGISEKSVLTDLGVAAIENPPALGDASKENIREESIFARPEIDQLAISRLAMICGDLGVASRDRFFKRILKIGFSEIVSNSVKCRAFDVLFAVGRVAEISRSFGNGLDDLCEMRAACMYLRAMERVKHFMTLKEFVISDKAQLASHLLSLNKRNNDILQIVAALVVDYDLKNDEQILGAVRDCLKLQGRSEIAAEIKIAIN